MGELKEIFWTLLHTITDVMPIAGIIFGFQFFVIRKKIPNLKRVLIGFGYVVLGLALFAFINQPIFGIGAGLIQGTETITQNIEAHWSQYFWVYVFAFTIGFSTTIAEPSLLAVAIKANEVSGGTIGIWGLRISVAIGVAFGISLGSWRIVTGLPLHWFIISGYIIVVIQTFYSPKLIVPLAYDSGGVTTSTVTVPIVAALGIGLASHVPGRSELLDGFGLIAFASLFPIISVLAYAQLSEWYGNRKKNVNEYSD